MLGNELHVCICGYYQGDEFFRHDWWKQFECVI
jgi:hypothetical protein